MDSLLSVYTPSGEEYRGIEIIRKWIHKNVPNASECYNDKIGNVAFSFGHGPKKIMVSGHIDEVCLRVKSITNEGFIIPVNAGGFDKKILPGSEVVILADDGSKIAGNVLTAPIHIWAHKKENTDKAWNFSDMRIDIGYESKEKVEAVGIHEGSIICPKHKFNSQFGENRLFGNALDDKAGVWITLSLLKELSNRNYLNTDKVTFIAAICVGEETGLRGAKVISHNINPDISIDIDVTHANDYGLLSGDDDTHIRLAKGFVISYGPDKSNRLNKIIESTSKDSYIDFQREATRSGGTNTDSIQLYSSDCETTLISLPLLAMHTPVETMDWRDIISAKYVLISVIESLDK